MDGYPFNQWGRWELDGKVERSGIANDFWNHWQPHIDKAKDIGLNAFRMGLSWARIQPSFSPDQGEEPPIDFAAIDRYAQIISDVYVAGMVPIITLYHFVQPAWVGVDLWHEDALVEKFLKFAKTALYELNIRLIKLGQKPVGFWVLFNEPDVIASNVYLAGEYPHNPEKMGVKFAVQAMDNIFYSYFTLYDYVLEMYEREGWERPLTGFNLGSTSLYEHDKAMVDLCFARKRNIPSSQLESYFIANRDVFYLAFDRIADRRLGVAGEARSYYEEKKQQAASDFSPILFKKAIETLYASKHDTKLDYIALDIYDLLLPVKKYEKSADYKPTPYDHPHRPPWWEWCLEQKTYGEYIDLYACSGYDLPIYLIENSVAHKQEKFGKAESRPDGLTRPQYLKETLSECLRAMQKGYPIQGYLYWSLCDNYEWGSYAVRLGLLEYDYEKMEIKDTDGLGFPTAKAYSDLITVMRSNDELRVRQEFETCETQVAQ